MKTLLSTLSILVLTSCGDMVIQRTPDKTVELDESVPASASTQPPSIQPTRWAETALEWRLVLPRHSHADSIRNAPAGSWRLPTRAELVTAYDAGQLNEYISESTSNVWTSTFVACERCEQAYTMLLSDGTLSQSPLDNEFSTLYVREVR